MSNNFQYQQSKSDPALARLRQQVNGIAYSQPEDKTFPTPTPAAIVASVKRTVTSTDSAAVRTATLSDMFVRLAGTADSTFTLYAANGLRDLPLGVRNVSDAALWTLVVTGTDLFYQGASAVASFVLLPGQSLPLMDMVDGAQGKWEVWG